MASKRVSGGGLKSLLGLVEKKFGKGALMDMAEMGSGPAVQVTSTGSLALDHALGTGGIPVGRIVEIYGPESSGKTTLMLHAIAEVQRAGKLAAFIDAEHALDMEYAQRLGVDPKALMVSQPDSGEDALELTEMIARSGEVGLIVLDSVAALTPRAEIEGEMGDTHVGLQARLMSQALRKLTSVASQTGTTIVFINQLRIKIGVMFGNPETTTGGNALKFYTSVRLEIRRGPALKRGEEIIGARTRVKVAKNKLAPPFRRAEFDLIFGTGICRFGELVDLGVEHEIIEKSGSWYAFEGERLGQGKDRARLCLQGDPALADRVRGLVHDALFPKTVAKGPVLTPVADAA